MDGEPERKYEAQRIDLHTHSLLSDGEVVPSELVRRAERMAHVAVGLTDHVDSSNLEWVAERIVEVAEDLNESRGIRVVSGVELTHVNPSRIPDLAKKARRIGIEMVVVHGETPIEPVIEGTNLAALKCNDVSFLAHPGLITFKQAELAEKTQTYLELTSRRGHSLANGRIARFAVKTGAKLLVNTDAHSPGELLTLEEAKMVAEGAGLEESEVEEAVGINPRLLLEEL